MLQQTPIIVPARALKQEILNITKDRIKQYKIYMIEQTDKEKPV